MNSNAKGKRLEREVAKMINDRLDANCRRTPCSGALEFKGDICSIDPNSIASEYQFEIKNVEALNIWAAHAQAARDRRIGCRKTSIVVFSRAHAPIYVSMEFRHLLDLWAEIEELREETKK